MLITREVLSQSPEIEAHDKMLENNPDRIEIWKCWRIIEERGKPEYPEKNLSDQGREPTTNLTLVWRRVPESNPAALVGGECPHHCATPLHEQFLTRESIFAKNKISSYYSFACYYLVVGSTTNRESIIFRHCPMFATYKISLYTCVSFRRCPRKVRDGRGECYPVMSLPKTRILVYLVPNPTAFRGKSRKKTEAQGQQYHKTLRTTLDYLKTQAWGRGGIQAWTNRKGTRRNILIFYCTGY